MTLVERTAEYNALVENVNLSTGSEFPMETKFRSHALADKAQEKIQDHILGYNTQLAKENTPKAKEATKEESTSKPQKKEKKAMAKKDKNAETTKEDTTAAKPKNFAITYMRWHILTAFGRKKKLTVGQIKDNMIENGLAEEKVKVVTMMAKALGENDYLENLGGEADDTKYSITKAGLEARKDDEPAEPVKKPKPEPAPEYVPLYTEDDLEGMKKKKRKKAIIAEAKNREEYDTKYPPRKKGTRSPSNSEDTIKVMEMWNEHVTDDFLMNRTPFSELVEKETGIAKSKPMGLWSKIYKDKGLTREEVSERLVASGVIGKPAKKKAKKETTIEEDQQTTSEAAPEKKKKKKKKGKK